MWRLSKGLVVLISGGEKGTGVVIDIAIATSLLEFYVLKCSEIDVMFINIFKYTLIIFLFFQVYCEQSIYLYIYTVNL